MKLDELKFCAQKKQQLMQNTEYLKKLDQQVEHSFKKQAAFSLYREKILKRASEFKIRRREKEKQRPVNIFKKTEFLWKISDLLGEADNLFIKKEKIKHIELKREKSFEIENKTRMSENIYRRIKKLRRSLDSK